ncbi:MAG TPA: PHP domain-containing protein, partial [Candidatus Limnocylindrales bacterium]|nr:PHP domain-containing protein [Candidatus Limnocylindrales bacterium]
MPTSFAELHCHSNFSFLDGASPVDDLAERAATLGMTALAVTDHNGLYGAVRFATAVHEAGLRAIVGMEVELLDSVVPDLSGVVVPRRQRRKSRAKAGGDLELDLSDPPPAEGRAVRPAIDRLRPPGHREPKREDLRGVRSRELGPHLVLLARDMLGYRSLCRLTSSAHLAGTKGAPKFTHALLAKHTEGLVALSGCRHGEVARRLVAGDRNGAAEAAGRLAAMFASEGSSPRSGAGAGAGFFLEMQHHLLPDDDFLVTETVRLANQTGLPTVVTNGAHYAYPADRELQDVLVCIKHGKTLEESAHLRRPNGEFHLKSLDEMAALPPATGALGPKVAAAWASGLSSAGELAESCDVDFDFEQYRFPGFPVPVEETAFSYLERLCHDGMRKRYIPLRPAVVKQLAHELEVIERTGLAEFFLICWDIMRFCRERGIPAQGRGSAGDSIVAYVLGITRVDPIRHRLLFERFINEGRTSYPDVDIDFASSRREEVIQYCYERYGADHTGMVCNLVTYRARSAVREVGYALGFPRPLVDRVAKALETYDSVMVRRDLEAEGGFGEFFTPDSASDAVAASPAAGGSLSAAVSDVLAGERGLLDHMGQLKRPARMLQALSDDEGGPGDSPASVRWLRAEMERAADERLIEAETHPALQRPPRRVDPDAGEDYRPPALRAADNEGSRGRPIAALSAPLLRQSAAVRLDDAGSSEQEAVDNLHAQKTEASKSLRPESADSTPLPPVRSSDTDKHASGARAGLQAVTGAAVGAAVGAVTGAAAHPSTIGLTPWDRWLELTSRIDGFPRHLSIHVGGMLITAAPLIDIAPLERATMPGRVVVQYDKRD